MRTNIGTAIKSSKGSLIPAHTFFRQPVNRLTCFGKNQVQSVPIRISRISAAVRHMILPCLFHRRQRLIRTTVLIKLGIDANQIAARDFHCTAKIACRFQQRNIRSSVFRRKCRTHTGHTAADDKHIRRFRLLLFGSRRFFRSRRRHRAASLNDTVIDSRNNSIAR